MKSSYTKRALAFWLAVAMVATSAPMAFATASTSPTSTMTETSDVGTPTPVAATEIKKVTISQNTVTVDGKNSPQDITVKAFSNGDGLEQNDITSKVDWSVTTTDGQQSDVTVDASGKVTVSAKAKKGTYTITAKGKASETTGTGTTTLTVSRTGEDVATSVTVSGGVDSVNIPGDADAAITENTAFTASVKNAFEEDVASPAVVWSVKPKKAENNDKVSISKDGKVTVKPGAVDDTVTVTVTCGSVSGTKTFKLVYADRVIKSIDEIWMRDAGKNVDVTQGLTMRVDETVELFVKGKDQYGDAIETEVVGIEESSDKLEVTSPNKIKATAKTDSSIAVTVKIGELGKILNVTVEPEATQSYTVTFTANPQGQYTYGTTIPTPTVEVKDGSGTVEVQSGDVRYEYRKIEKVSAVALNSTLTTMPTDVGTYQVVAYYNANGHSASSEAVEFEITKKPVTVTADNKTITKGDAIPTLTFSVPSGALVNGDKQDALGVKLTTTATSSSPAGTYDITGTADSKNYAVTVTPGKLTIKAETGIRMVAGKSSEDSNRSRYDLSTRYGTGYLDLNADADDYLSRQTVDGSKDYWIGFDLDVYLDGASKNIQDLYVSSTGKSTDWKKISDLNNSRRYIDDFYLDNLSGTSFTLWFDTDDDSDNSDRLYFATSSSGANEYYIDVDFDAYRGSSSSSSGSSSSDTSKVNGDRVSTTTVDKTPSVKNGSATVTFSSSALSDALDANKKEAKREKADKTYIELDVKTSKSVDDTTITVPRSSLDKIADEDTGLKLTTNQGTVTFDYRALAEIYDACDKTNIEFYLEEEDDDQYVLLIKDGSSDVIDLGRGSVEVTFDYKLKSGEKSSDVKVYRIGNGDKTWLSTYGGSTVYGAADVYAAAPTYVTDMKADYSSSKKKVTFTTDALGTFLITTDTLKTGSGSTTTTPTYNAFVDVPSSRWSATYINKLASLGIINGTGGGYFEPTLYVTREEFVKMLAGVAGANVTGYTSSRFPDVPLSRWSAPYIAWAADRGITTGTDGGNFAPTMRITREEMATMIYRYVQSSGKTLPAKNAPVIFADANLISGWAQTPVSVMQQAGIIDGNVTNGRYTFDPKVSASREECAKMLAVLYDLVR